MRLLRHGLFVLLIILTMLAQPAASTPAAAAALAGPVTVDLTAVADARTQGGSLNTNFGSGFLYVATLNGHISFVAFDLLALPAGATIEAARLELDAPTLNNGPNNVELGRVDGPWDEAALTWANQPAITWGGPVTNVVGPTLATWDVTPMVQSWYAGTTPNYGFALRGDGGQGLSFSSKDAGAIPPTLVVRYSIPDDQGGRPDVGDAPDSTNHHGVPNTAYAGAGVNGQFPTVWQVPAGQAAGPRHENATGEGFLGQYLSREQDADTGADQDGRNNILRDAAGAIVDVADQDRGDDGWRNRNIRFFDCRRQTLTVRVSKAPAATLKKMYLNVWFDGNRDGDWADSAACADPSGGPAQASYEWIVQDYVVDMTAVPAGGFLDFNIDTERVMNATGGKPHWMRFTLSERRTVQGAGGAYPDGRGPHPTASPGSYQFGETEDVLQVPPPPAEPGTLEIQKRVITQGTPVDYPGQVTYEIRLHHAGGDAPMQVQLRDQIGFPQHLLPHLDGSGQAVYIEAVSPGGAAPLQADLRYVDGSSPGVLEQLVSWDGTLAPEAEITFRFDVHVHPYCGTLQQTATVTNTARARQVGGAEISAEASFEARCPGYGISSVEVNPELTELDLIDLRGAQNTPLRYSLKNTGASTLTLGLSQERANAGQTNALASPPIRQIVTIAPGESKPIEVALDLGAADADNLAGPDAITVESRLRYCLVVDQAAGCPDPAAYPNLTGQGPLVKAKIKRHDLGDAPDSSNHAGAAMAAYPGVPAGFPTVFDPATGMPQGPLHAHPRPFHLGQQVSVEAEADVGPDQDPSNNILPAANQPDRDRADDGARLNRPAANCQATTADVRVAITPAAWSWFKGREQPAYLNAWADSNQDGDWADGFSCPGPNGQQADVVEHVIIDEPIDVVALGPGLHTLSVPTGRLAWPGQGQMWVRFTLSERPANKTLTYNGISYGDGRGFAAPFATGETEDYLVTANGGEVIPPDLAVSLDGQATSDRVAYRVELTNQGGATASGATLTFTPPAALAGRAPDFVRAPGTPESAITSANGTISVALPAISDGTSNTLLFGWSLAALRSAQAAPQAIGLSATASVALAGDSDSSNNSASFTLERPREPILLAAKAAGGATWGQRDTTCRSSVTLVGRAEPNGIIAILIGLLVDGKATADANGNFSYTVNGLSPGRNQIQAVYDGQAPANDRRSSVWLDVDPSLPVDPLSLYFEDSVRTAIYHPPTLGWGSGADADGIRLKPGQAYTIGIDSCLSQPVRSMQYTLTNVYISSLYDDDGDGRYTGSFTYSPIAPQAASLAQSGAQFTLSVAAGGVTRSIGAAVSSAAGSVTDGASGQALAGAEVRALTASGDLWPAAALGAANPQTTAAGGAYSFGAAGSPSRLSASRSGYQSYTSWDIDGATLDRPVALTPEQPGTPDLTIYITAGGFDPPLASVSPGALVEWVNLDLADHTASGAGWDSGALAPGGRFRARLTAAGDFSYSDAAGLAAADIIVEGVSIYLPLVRR